MFPERGKCADSGGVIAVLQKVAQPFPLGPAVHREFGIVDVDLQLGCEKFREARVGKIENEARASDKVNEIIDKA